VARACWILGGPELKTPPTIDGFQARILRVAGQWPVVSVLLPWEQVMVHPRGFAMKGPYDGPTDAWGTEPAPRAERDALHVELGFWPDGEDRGLLLPRGAADYHMIAMHGSWRVPPLPGTLRARFVHWMTTNPAGDPVDGAWGEPQRVDLGFIASQYESDEESRLWTATASNPTHDPIPGEPSALKPYLPIAACGDPGWEPPEGPPQELADMERLPAPSAGAKVSDETAAWVRSRAKRYGRSRTGRHWQEIARAL